MIPPDTSASVGSVRLANPVIAASGTCGSGTELARVSDVRALGAVVTKTVTLSPREGNPPVRVAETPCGMLNSIGLENPGVERFVERILPEALALGVPVVASVAGGTPEEYAACVRALDRAGGVVAIELNLSCPNDRRCRAGARTPLAFGQDPSAAAEAVSAAREATGLPLWAKLTAAVADIVEVARAAVESGADALVAVNTLPAIAVDTRAKRLVLGAGQGGLSGPAMMPVALRCVWDLAREGLGPVVGCGGASSAEDVAAYLMAGASAVEMGTAILRDPASAARAAGELGALVASLGASSVAGLVGAALGGERA